MSSSSSASPRPLLLSIEDVCLSYGERHVLCHLSQQIHAGECFLLTGPNGGGKTTLLRLMAGLLKPTRGTLHQPRPLRLGYLPQYRRIDRQFPATVLDVVLSGLHAQKPLYAAFKPAHKAQALQALERFGIAELAPRPIHALSGGQWQRTLLARAFAAQPELLLLDEPETHLDASARQHLAQLLHAEMQRGTTLVVVSHDELCLRPALIKAGAKEWSVAGEE